MRRSGARPIPKLSFNQFNDRQRGFKEDIELVARAGYEGIGISKIKLEPYGIQAGLQLIKDSGLAVACYSATGRFLIPGELDRQVEETKRCIETAARLHASCLVIVTGPRHGLEWEEANRRFQDGLTRVLPEAERHGVRVAVEALPPFRTNMSYLHNLRDVLDVVEEIDSPHFGVLLDSGTTGRNGTSLRACARVWIRSFSSRSAIITPKATI